MPDKRINGLYLITPEMAAAKLVPLCAEVVDAAAVLQYRSSSPNIQTARRLAKLCAEAGAVFIVNNDVHLAKQLSADGVHLGVDDMPITTAREMLGDNAIIGATCGGDINLAICRWREGADYCAFGAMYPSTTKPEKPLCPPDIIIQASKVLSIPIVAIGGITTETAKAVINNGANAIAISAAVFASPAPAKTARAISNLFPRHS